MSQDGAMDLDHVYGLDQTLINGKKYTFIPPPGTKGDQFLISPVYMAGSVSLRGKCYEDQSLNYDIYNQQLLLQYANDNFPRNTIEVSAAWLQGFTLGHMKFELLHLEQEPHFYQVLGEGAVRILYYWRKNMDVEGAIGSVRLTFTRTVRDSFVHMEGQLKPFKTKRRLIRLFDPGHRSEIKNYLRKNKIKVKKASDHPMAELITFIGNLK